jgi:hypothetical protein
MLFAGDAGIVAPLETSRARYTSPMPPAPSGPRISYVLSRVPVARLMMASRPVDGAAVIHAPGREVVP